MPWRREWLPTPVFLPGEFHGQRSLAGYIQSMGSQSRARLSDFHIFASPSHAPSGSTSLPPVPQSPHHSGRIFPRSSLCDLFCAYLVCHSASLSQPISFDFSLLLPESRAGCGWTSLCFCPRVGQAVAGLLSASARE